MRFTPWMTAPIVCLAWAPGCKAPEPRAAVDPMLSVNTLIEAPPDFAARRVGSPRYPIPPYAKHLAGVKICLDPGHGGDAQQRGFKRGPTGVREAEMNLRVANYLREFLHAAGAEVRLTRADDSDISLEDRAGIANEWGADLFISVHHNAIDSKPQVNYTSVWYHAGVDYRPSNLDLARYLCDGLQDALHLPQYTDVPLKSDQLMYASGFAVLRHARVTAALTESCFYTNPEQEQRLRDPEYNLREAYGLFLGLARYAAAGLPRARLVAPSDGIVRVSHSQNSPHPQGADPGPAGRVAPDPSRERADAAAGAPRPPETTSSSAAIERADVSAAEPPEMERSGAPALIFALDDGLRSRKAWGHERQMILRDSIVVRIADRVVRHTFENDGYRLTVELPDDLPPGEHAVEVQFVNLNKNSVLNPHFVVRVE